MTPENDISKQSPLPAFQPMAFDVMQTLLQLAETPKGVSKFLTQQMRELTGARTVILMQCLHNHGETGHKTFHVDPVRREKTAATMEISNLADILHKESFKTTLWDIETANDNLKAILEMLDCELAIGVPLMIGDETVGVILLLGIPGKTNIQAVVDLCDMISTLVALVFNNSLLFEKQEEIILGRTEELKKSEERFRALAENTSDWIWELDLSGYFKYVNPKITEIIGCTVKEIVGKSISDITIPEEKYRNNRIFHEMISEKKSLKNWETYAKHKNGSVIALEINGVPIFDNHGFLTGYRGITRDITERKKAENELRHIVEGTASRTGDDFFRELTKNLASALDMRYALAVRTLNSPPTRAKTFVIWNGKEFGENFEYDLEGTPCKEVVSGRKVFYTENVRKHFPNDPDLTTLNAESYMGMPLQDKSGKVIGHFAVLDDKPIIDEKKKFLIMDIFVARTEAELERVIIEQENTKLQNQLFQSQKMESIGRLAGGIAHDFNNILASIMGYAELLSIKISDRNTSEGKAADIIYKGAQRAAKLTHQLLGFARAGKYEQKPVNVNRVIEEILKVSEKIFEKQIHLNCDYDEEIYTVSADKNQFDQVFTNIFINAKDAMPNGGELSIKTENTTVSEVDAANNPELTIGDYVRISFTDSGTGMPKDISEKIFEPFFTTKGEGKGTGLGLASVYGIIKNHDGYIYCESEQGVGTTFTIYLPASEETIAEAEKDSEIIHGDSTILVVDDEENVLGITKKALENLDYTVLTANDGDEALEIYKREKENIGLILLDMIMPGKTGKETYIELKKINPDVRVLLSSGYSAAGQASELLKEGDLGFIQKPFSIQALSKAVADALSNKQ